MLPRDQKGLYQRARRGEIDEFTGVSSPYEPPEHPSLILDAANTVVDECAARVIALVNEWMRNATVGVAPDIEHATGT